MSITTSERLANLEASLVSINNRIDELATDEEIFSISEEVENILANLNDKIEQLKSQLSIVESILKQVEAERTNE
jgi:small-conductance mechanosensitive channel